MSRPPSRRPTAESNTTAPPSNSSSNSNLPPTSVMSSISRDGSQTSLKPYTNDTSQILQDSIHSQHEPSNSTSSSSHPNGQPPSSANNATTSATESAPAPSTSLSGLVCNVHRTTGKEPHPLVGAATVILGDKLYVFGGRVQSRSRPHLTANLFELDLIRRHWTKIETRGEAPAPRYFHSLCALGDSKLVCYGGMSPTTTVSTPVAPEATGQPPANAPESQPEVVVMSDIHIYDVPTRRWSFVPTHNTPQGRYAHCATVLPSSAAFSSAEAPRSAIHHNPASPNPNQGSIGVSLDGAGGAEMVVVGGQDSANHYIEQISVFNLRSLKWIATDPLGKSCGAYRSVVAPLSGMPASKVGEGIGHKDPAANGRRRAGTSPREVGSSMLIYSNYNFLDVKLELQVRLPDGTLTEKQMRGDFNPPGLRFPNGGVIDHHFVVSGTYLTTSRQEYALWALDLRNLTWSRIDAGGNHFSQGSWNRGILWQRRNTFVVLGNRKRSLVEDYNHRRINFSNVCMVELEAFGMYDNPRRTGPMSGFVSASSPCSSLFARPHNPTKNSFTGGGRPHLSAAEELGKAAMGMRELADMDLLAMGGERIPVNSRIISQRWGPYFTQLLREGAARQENTDTATLRPPLHGGPSRNSSVTITPSIGASSTSTSTTLTANNVNTSGTSPHHASSFSSEQGPPTPNNLQPAVRPRTLYLPHTHLTLQTLVHFLYTSSLPNLQHPLCTPQILCSLLQLARPYQIDGLLEAVVERLHQLLDGRNAAAVFNAAAMAAGGGQGGPGRRGARINPRTGLAQPHHLGSQDEEDDLVNLERPQPDSAATANGPGTSGDEGGDADALENATAKSEASTRTSTSAGTNTTTNTSDYDLSDTGLRGEREVWSGEISSVVGLQKRGLRGLMEGRRLRERERGRSTGASGIGGVDRGEGRVGLGIA
ncbi:MAG: hypothetical protein M1817_000157 [Caeruleum heppii]|nr:MAG: hypothetical protein M1817_000157 [Caeruleum heppii]